ncbi:DNA-directed RNA polymerase II subunit rpb7 [Zancudomyces culisetae]|uniref:DNA-directed RNA polymerase II subunit rpb7 n=1 Tax=Zancudomyces culisetae TaxID=1213189 RepID=A0A1R1PKU4_ZANCU|nr:DNA-directed RNA polymerase II subunit rpb7 [Zancudomyces culisetae]|eukprot:OMH81492.1 DNA-directed RNA polymerase II subunit rpb7 [Zancudomyces culisetae]
MFFLKELTHRITLHPSFLGPQIRSFVTSKLYRDVEGTCSGRYGYIVTVVALVDIGKGRILPNANDGSAEFLVRVVNKMGFFVSVGPLQVFVSSHLIPADMQFDASSNPPCFVSKTSYASASDVKFKIKDEDLNEDEAGDLFSTQNDQSSSANIKSLASSSGGSHLNQYKIEKGTNIRVKIVGLRVDSNEIFAIGTIKEDYLGVIEAAILPSALVHPKLEL